ncbi:MAG: SCP2 sterol-binding domain-containing protein [Gaiellaceae bacterium]
MSARRKPADPTAEFFAGLAELDRDPLLAKANGTIRFDLRDGRRVDRWLVSLKDGEVTVSRANRDADCVIRVDKALFDEIAVGKANGTAAVLRGAMTIDGEMELMMVLRRTFPGPRARATRSRNGRRPA